MRYLAAVLLCAIGAPAFAHDGHDHVAAMDVKTLTASAAYRIGSFDFDATNRGHYQTLAVGATWAPTSWLRLQGTTPWSYLRLADGRGAIGLGDVSADASFLIARGRWTAIAGVASAAPTGDPEVGIGSGHFELTPHIAGRFSASRLAFEAMVAQQSALGTDEDDGVPHGALLAPHARHETHVDIAGTYTLSKLQFGLSGRGIAAHDLPMGGTSAGAFVAVRPSTDWMLSADFSAPLTGFKRYAWRSGVLANFFW